MKYFFKNGQLNDPFHFVIGVVNVNILFVCYIYEN